MNKFKSILLKSLHKAKEDDYESYDISNLMQTKYYALTSKLSHGLMKKALQKPYKILMKKSPSLIRKVAAFEKHKYPQAFAMLIRANVQLLSSSNLIEDLDEVKKMAQWLLKNRSPYSEHYGWGQPFLWYSQKPFPANTPRATVSSQVAWAFLDLFEYTKNEDYLNVAEDVCRLFVNDFNYRTNENGHFCLSYTIIDNYHIHNANMLAASVIFRVANLTNSDELLSFGKKLVDFTLSYQNEDGSFYYWAPPNKLNYMIDNYHTGFVLESLFTICEDYDSDRYQKAYELGMDFYYRELFDGPVPKLSTKNKYPIDIQSCAQSIITFSQNDTEERFGRKAKEIADYTANKLFLNDKNHFAYRLYKNGKIDKSYYFRWGDAWMIRALSNII